MGPTASKACGGMWVLPKGPCWLCPCSVLEAGLEVQSCFLPSEKWCEQAVWALFPVVEWAS